MLTAQKKPLALRFRAQSHRIGGGEAMPTRFKKDLALPVFWRPRHSAQTPAGPMFLAMPAPLPPLSAALGGLLGILCLRTFPGFFKLWRNAAAQATPKKKQNKVTHL